MANYITNTQELTSVANAIRTKTGESSQLIYPNGFVTAIGSISGGGDSDFSTAEVTFVNDNTVGAYEITLFRLTNDGLALDKIIVQASEPVIVNIPLYKGKCTFSLIIDDVDMEVMPTTTGGVVIDFNTSALIITGNGTFTAKGIASA